jgi:hypothetical protein
MAVVFAADSAGTVDGHAPTATLEISNNAPSRILEFEDENFTNRQQAPSEAYSARCLKPAVGL